MNLGTSAIRLRAGGALALLLGFMAGASPAGNRGVALRLGDTVTGEIGPAAADADDFLVELSEGTLVDAKATAPKGSALIPYLRFLDPAGQQALDLGNFTSGANTKKFSVKKYPVPRTGTWLVRVVGGPSPGDTGVYGLKLTGKPPKKEANGNVSLTDLQVKRFPFGGSEDGQVTLTLKDRSGPPIAIQDVRVLGPGGDPIPGVPQAIRRKGKAITAKNVPLTDGFGDYVLEIQGPPSGGPSVFDVTIQVKAPKLQAKSLGLASTEPQVAQVTPSKGPAGATLTVNGSGFVPGCVVWLADTVADSVVLQDSTSLTCTAPGGPDAAAGLKVRVSVQNPDGQENGKDAAFEYATPPRPTSVLPNVGPTRGGELVTVYGSGFRVGASGYSVTFGGVPATAVQVLGSSQVQCRPPAAPPGPVAVVVTDEFGQVGTLAGTYLYVIPPGLTSLTPGSGPASGGTLVTLTGTGFRTSDRVLFGAKVLSPVTVLSPTSIQVTTSPTVGGVVDVKVMDEFLDFAVLPGAFRFQSHLEDRTISNLPSQGSSSAPAGWDVAIGDLDGDGDRDLVLADDFPFSNSSSLAYSSLHVLTNNGALAFTDSSLKALPAPRFLAYPAVSDRSWQGVSVQLGDLDGDSHPDLVVSNRNAFTAYPYGQSNGGYYYYVFTAGTRVLLNDGKGGFKNPTKLLTAYYYSGGMGNPNVYGYNSVANDRWQADKNLLGDLDGDGKADLVLISSAHVAHLVVTGGTYYAYPGGSSATRILKGNGDGTFKYIPGAVPLAPTDTRGFPYLDDFAGTDARLGDLDGDGKPDIAVTHKDLRPAAMYPNSYPASYGSQYMIGTRILTNNGSGGFNFSYVNIPVTHGFVTGSTDFLQADSIAMGDLDGDGSADLVLASKASFPYYDPAAQATYYRPGVRILLNDGKGFFGDATNSAWGGPFPAEPYLNASSVELGDVDGDGATDIVLVSTTAYVLSDGTGATRTTGTRVFLNDGSGHFNLAPLSSMADTTASNDQGIFFTGRTARLGDLDGDGDLDFVITNSYDYVVSGGWYTMLLEER